MFGLMRIGEFAEKCGLTIRTLRYYDNKGLLKPRIDSYTGYRFYSYKDFTRLEEILALKFLGFTLKEIKTILEKRNRTFREILSIQHSAIKDKIEQLQDVLKVIETAESAIHGYEIDDWQYIINIIRSIKMENSKDWAEQFYSPEQLDNLKNRNYSPEQAQADAKRWNDLIRDVRNNLSVPPDSPEIQQLVDRWLALLNEFTLGDPGMQNSVNKLWANADSGPSEFKEYYGMNKDVFDFMAKAINARK